MHLMTDINFVDYLEPNAVILVVALYAVGLLLKQTTLLKDKYIPLLLLTLSLIASISQYGITINAIYQGIIATAVAVFTHQIYKQSKKEG